MSGNTMEDLVTFLHNINYKSDRFSVNIGLFYHLLKLLQHLIVKTEKNLRSFSNESQENKINAERDAVASNLWKRKVNLNKLKRYIELKDFYSDAFQTLCVEIFGNPDLNAIRVGNKFINIEFCVPINETMNAFCVHGKKCNVIHEQPTVHEMSVEEYIDNQRKFNSWKLKNVSKPA